MEAIAAIAVRFLGPKIVAGVPWRLIAILMLIAGVGASYWAVENHGFARGKIVAQPRILHAGVLAGMDAQVAADGIAVTRAFVAAAKAQHIIVAAEDARAATLSKGAEDALASLGDSTDRMLAAWRLRHAASSPAPGRTGEGRATPISATAGGDHGSAAPLGGLVAVPVEAIADAAKDSDQLARCSKWIADQRAAWPN